MIAGIEVKASATVKAGDFGGLRALADACGNRFAFGVVLYDSADVVPFGDRLAAAPLSSLWNGAPLTNRRTNQDSRRERGKRCSAEGQNGGDGNRICKLACNNDPLRGGFRVHNDPSDVVCQRPSLWPGFGREG